MNLKNLPASLYLFFSTIIFCSFVNAQDNFAVSSDGVKIVFDKQGNGEPAIIFVHGWSNNKSIWDDQMQYFSKKYTSIAVDLPGFGKSGNNRTNWSIKSFGDDAASVIDKLNLSKVVLVGFSMGAPVVIETAIKIPGTIAGVVLVDNLHNIEMKTPPQMISQMDSVFTDLVQNPSNEKLTAFGFYKNNQQQAYQRILSMLEDTLRIGWRESFLGTFQWYNEHCIESLKQMQVPLAAINTDRQPTNKEAIRKYVSDFNLKIIEGSGHVVMWDETDKFNRLLEEIIEKFVSKGEN